MLLYEYPPKLDRHGRQLKAVHDIEERKKMQRNMYKNLTLGLIIVFIGILIPAAVFKVIVMFIGAANIVTAYLLYRFSALSRDTECYTRIYEDRIEHCQGSLLTGNHTKMIIYYDDVVKSYQNPFGKLIVHLKGGYVSEINSDKRNKSLDEDLQNNQITMFFQDTKAKLYLIENLYEQIKYPKKEYNIIEDEEDEDDLWDPLHKHGL